MEPVPFAPTPEEVARRALQLAGLKPGEIVYDLGCGDGRIIAAAGKYFNAKAVGIEIRRGLIYRAQDRIRRYGLRGEVGVIHGNFFNQSISEADIVTLYLLPSTNLALKPKLESELRRGVRIVAIDYPIPGWKPTTVHQTIHGNKLWRIFLYTV